MATSSKDTIRVEGLTELRKALRDAPAAARKELSKANKAAAQVVADEAKSTVPRRTGRLAASIAAQATQTAGKVKAGSAARVPYAGPIHYGWGRRHIRPNPFLMRALSRERQQVIKAYEAAMERFVDALDI